MEKEQQSKAKETRKRKQLLGQRSTKTIKINKSRNKVLVKINRIDIHLTILSNKKRHRSKI